MKRLPFVACLLGMLVVFASPVRSVIGGRSMVLANGNGENLPYDAEVEYLESVDGFQHIDTGVIGSQLYDSGGLEVDCMPLTLSRYTPVANIDSDHNLNFLGLNDNAGTIYSRLNDGLTTFTANLFGLTSFLNTRIVQRALGGTCEVKIGETIRTSSYNQFCANNSSHLYLFYGGNIGGLAWYGLFRVYSAKCWFDPNTLAFDFIPVRFTNELGQSEGAMYDRVSGQLFRNAGTGNFVIGPDL